MSRDYKGTIIEESLEDNRVINGLEIVGFKISRDENPGDRWHVYTVRVSKDDISNLSRYLKLGKWYMHFWWGRNVLAIFRDKIFEFNYDDKTSWKNAVDYGLSIGIPKEQLDFPIEE